MARRVVDEPLDPEPEIRAVADPESGALVVLRAPGADAGGPADPDRARSFAEGVLEELEAETVRRFGVRRCALRHRPAAGPGEAAFLAVVRAPHRADAFEAAEWAMAEARERLP